MPAEGQLPGDRGLAVQQQLYPAAPVSEVWKADDHLLAHSQQLLEDLLWFLERLYRLREYDVIEALVCIVAQSLFNILLNDRQTPADTVQGPGPMLLLKEL